MDQRDLEETLTLVDEIEDGETGYWRPVVRNIHDAQVLKKFGDAPEDLSAL